MLNNTLIENALALSENNGIIRNVYEYNPKGEQFFSIEKFCYYLCSIPFSIEYLKKTGVPYTKENLDAYAYVFFSAISLYQEGNEKPLIELLQKIK